jgi:hypothetical protein
MQGIIGQELKRGVARGQSRLKRFKRIKKQAI